MSDNYERMTADAAELAGALDALERGKPLTPLQLKAWLNRPCPYPKPGDEVSEHDAAWAAMNEGDKP